MMPPSVRPLCVAVFAVLATLETEAVAGTPRADAGTDQHRLEGAKALLPALGLASTLRGAVPTVVNGITQSLSRQHPDRTPLLRDAARRAIGKCSIRENERVARLSAVYARTQLTTPDMGKIPTLHRSDPRRKFLAPQSSLRKGALRTPTEWARAIRPGAETDIRKAA